MPFSLYEPPGYIQDQVFGYQSVNKLFDNDVALRDSFAQEHAFGTGVHITPRVAWVQGSINWNGVAYSLNQGTHIASLDQAGLAAGQCRVNFDIAFAAQDWGTFVTAMYGSGGEAAGWAWDGSSLSSIIVDLVNGSEILTDMDFSIACFGVAT